MKTFDTYIAEAENKARVAIGGFLNKIEMCKTCAGVEELEKFYQSRIKDVEITDAEDIQIRDALAGRKEDLSGDNEVEPEEF